ncbi:hypothetical protein [Pseudomonas sp. IT-P74]|uniref:hypothetical protein n=1 Tax=Pseudomonas sp. IT-P74 TaxID=3026445 RepID=UPI000F9611CC
MKTVITENIISDGFPMESDWQAKFKIVLTDSEFQNIVSEVQFGGRFTAEGQRYFYGYDREMQPNDWVLRVNFSHFDFELNVDYKVGSGGFSALLIQGGNDMVSGGFIVGGTVRFIEMNPVEGKIHGQFTNVWTEGGRPDGSDMDPAYARVISFASNGKRV